MNLLEALEFNPRLTRRGLFKGAFLVGLSTLIEACGLGEINNPKQIAREYIEALKAGDNKQVLKYLDPATRHNLQNNPQMRDGFTRFVQDFRSYCGDVPIRDTVITLEVQQPAPLTRVEVLLGRSCQAPIYSYYTKGPSSSSRGKVPENSSIPILVQKIEGRWYPALWFQ